MSGINVCIFNPCQLLVLSKTLADFQSIPSVLDALDEWQFHAFVSSWLQNRRRLIDVITFWRAVKDRLLW